MHENHRHRVRERYINEGLESFADHNVLELLLFYSIPRCDTNAIAHRLIDTFGSLDRVFDATYDRLRDVEGIGENTAALITMIPQLCKRYLTCKSKKKLNISDKEEFAQFVVNRFHASADEELYLFCLDGNGALINSLKVCEGSTSRVVVDKRVLLEAAFRNAAQAVAVAHNHPNGIVAPSREDVRLTSELVELFGTVGIKLVDHYIVGGSDYLSMASTEKFKLTFI